MPLTKPEFKVLKALSNRADGIPDSAFDRVESLSTEELRDAETSLVAAGFVADGHITEAGFAALEPYRVKNVVVQAAGQCTRFAPISYDMPKGLIPVHGEPLVERQIRQLHEVGITDITFVVGHKKEMYAYLGAKYDVKFVENPDYTRFNTMTTLYRVRERLGRTYILFSDIYLAENPFERYVYEGYYAVSPVEGHTEEWIYKPGPDGYVNEMVPGGDSGEYVAGFACLDETIAANLVPALEEEYGKPDSMRQFWEAIWFQHRDSVHIRTRCLPAAVSFEFDTMDQLRAFDASYLNDVSSPSLDNICRFLSCTREDLHDCYSLTVGITKMSCHVAVGESEYIYRHPVDYSPIKIDRAVEAYANKLAFDADVDPSFIYEDPEAGWKLCHAIAGARMLDRENADEATAASRLLGVFQAATRGISVERDYDRWQHALSLEQQIASRGYELDEHTMSFRERVARLAAHVEADAFPRVLSHNDAWFGKFFWDESGSLSLLNWEFAGMADWLSDLACHTETYYISVPPTDREFMRTQLRAFLGREETPAEWRHFVALVMIACWKVSVWTIDFFSESNVPTDWDIEVWLGLCHGLLDAQLDYAVSLYEA